jgi:hypothetical protein
LKPKTFKQNLAGIGEPMVPASGSGYGWMFSQIFTPILTATQHEITEQKYGKTNRYILHNKHPFSLKRKQIFRKHWTNIII